MSATIMSKVSAGQTRGALSQVKQRLLHGSLKRQGILMPAMSPLMTEGTITRWKKKEGDSFVAGDILLQIESDLYTIDVEAQCPGILGKILIPDGTSHVPVEQLIALVAKDMNELAVLQNQSHLPLPPPMNALPDPPSASLASPRLQQLKPLSSPSPSTPTMSPRTPSLFEMQTMGYGQRSTHSSGSRGTVPASRSFDSSQTPTIQPLRQEISPPLTTSSTRWSPCVVEVEQERSQVDGAAIRRMIVSNLSSQSTTRPIEFDELL